MSVKRGSYHVKLVRWWNWASGFNQDRFHKHRPSWPVLVFSMNEAWRERKVSVKDISFKTRECYWYEAKRPHAWLWGLSTRHPRTWHWDPWLIREAGLWKSRNLGIRFWRRACWHGDIPLQLSWTRMTWVCYWDEKLWRAHTYTCVCTRACMVCLHCLHALQRTGA